MSLDASIPLQVQPSKMMTPGDMVSLQNVARQGQLQQVQLEEAQQGQVKKNMLRQLMQEPGAVDPATGRLTPQALAKITVVDQEKGLQLGHQQEQLRLQDLAVNQKKDDLKKHVGTSYVTAYDRYLQQTGGNTNEATRLAQQDTLAAITEMEKGGSLAGIGLDATSIQKLKTLPPPEQMRSMVISMGGQIPDKGPTQRQERKRIDGLNEVQEEFDPVSKSWREIGKGPRFANRTEEGAAPAGYRFSKTKPGTLEPIPGGPGAPQTALSEEYAKDSNYKKSVDFWANLLKDGGTLPPRFAQSGSGKKMMPDILNVVPTLGTGGSKDMLASQVDLAGQKSEARAIGSKAANVEMAAGEAREMMPILQKTSEAFERTGYQPINKVFKAYQDNTGSVESRQFGAALNSFVNVYARAVSPSGTPTVSDKDHAREVLSTADSHKQLLGLLKVLDQEMVAAQNAPKRVREAQRAGITGTDKPAQSSPDGGAFADTEKEKRYQAWKASQGK